MFQSKISGGNSDKIILLGLIVILTILLVVMVFRRDVVIDEGIYLYAGKLVAAGKIPYIDFIHSQGPLFPIIYGLINILFGQDIYINRIITAIFGFSGLIFGGLIAKKIGGNESGAIYFIFCIVSVYLLLHYVVVTTYGITTFFLFLSLFLAVNYENKFFLSYVFILKHRQSV